MFTQLQSRHCGERVCMLAGADNYRIEMFFLVKKFSEIDVLGRFWMSCPRRVEVVFIYITQRDNVFGRHGISIGSSAALPRQSRQCSIFHSDFDLAKLQEQETVTAVATAADFARNPRRFVFCLVMKQL